MSSLYRLFPLSRLFFLPFFPSLLVTLTIKAAVAKSHAREGSVGFARGHENKNATVENVRPAHVRGGSKAAVSVVREETVNVLQHQGIGVQVDTALVRRQGPGLEKGKGMERGRSRSEQSGWLRGTEGAMPRNMNMAIQSAG